MPKDTIGFSESYPKFKFPKMFSTIRRYDKYPKAGEKVEVFVRGAHPFKAKILWKFKTQRKRIPTPFLCYDTDKKSSIKAIEKLDSFYKNPTDREEKLTVLFLERVEK